MQGSASQFYRLHLDFFCPIGEATTCVPPMCSYPFSPLSLIGNIFQNHSTIFYFFAIRFSLYIPFFSFLYIIISISNITNYSVYLYIYCFSNTNSTPNQSTMNDTLVDNVNDQQQLTDSIQHLSIQDQVPYFFSLIVVLFSFIQILFVCLFHRVRKDRAGQIMSLYPCFGFD